MSTHIAIDIGGTQMRAASYPQGTLDPVRINRIPSNFPGSHSHERLAELIRSVWPDGQKVCAMGTAIAGPLDISEGRIIKSPNISDLDGFPIVAYLSKEFDVPVALGNDANLAALGEWKYGAGQGHNDLLYITISTGIGSGIISDGKMLLGSRGMGAELGHTTIIPDGPICSCGHPGHLEAIASGTAITKWFKAQLALGESSALSEGKSITSQSIAEAARQGDSLAQAAYRRAGEYLGLSLTNFIHIFNPTLVIFGGGVSKSIDLLLPYIESALKKHIFAPGYLDDLTITTAALGDDAGLLGALALAREFEP